MRFLRDMLHHAFHDQPVLPGAGEPIGWRYTTAWGRPGDRAVVALDRAFPIGAAWFRRFPAAEPGYGFLDEETPELAIAVVPDWRRRGIGKDLLAALLEQARADGVKALSLSVRRDNPAIALYESFGFRPVAERGDARLMRVEL